MCVWLVLHYSLWSILKPWQLGGGGGEEKKGVVCRGEGAIMAVTPVASVPQFVCCMLDMTDFSLFSFSFLHMKFSLSVSSQ